MARALADAAVGDRFLGVVEALLRVQLGEVVVRLEGAVLVCGGAPRDVDGSGDVATLLRLLLRKVGGSEDLAGELVRAANVDEVLAADGVDDLVAECADREVGGLGLVLRGFAVDCVLGERASVEFPLLRPPSISLMSWWPYSLKYQYA